MNALSSISLEQLYSILRTCNNIGPFKLPSDKGFSKLFNGVTEREQQELATFRQRAEVGARQVQNLTSSGGPITSEVLDFHSRALENLKNISDRYRIFKLFPERGDDAWRRQALESIPQAIRADVLTIAHTMKENLPSEAVIRAEVLPILGEELLFLSALPAEERALIYLDTNFLIRQRLGMTPQTYCQLIREVAQFQYRYDLISIRLLTLRCEDSDFLLRIVATLRDLPDDRRDAIIRATCRMIDRDQYSSGAIYAMLLTQISSYKPEPPPARLVFLGAEDTIEFVDALLAGIQLQEVEEEEDPYVLEIGRADFVSNPFQTLQTLTELFDEGRKDSLKIEFIGEKGTGDGPTREFVAELFNGVCDKLAADGPSRSLFRPHGHKNREVYVNLGKLLMFCFSSKDGLLIGRHLHPSVYVALTMLSDTIPRIKAFEAMYSVAEGDRDVLAQVQKGLDSSDEEMQKMAQEMVDSALSPFIAIWEGMQSAPFKKGAIADLLLMTPEELARALEGTLDVEEVISKLDLDSFSDRQKVLVKNWIRGFDEPKMKQFLYAMTGIPALGKNTLSFRFKDKEIQSFTCYNILFLPKWCNASEEQLIATLEAAIFGKKHYTSK